MTGLCQKAKQTVPDLVSDVAFLFEAIIALGKIQAVKSVTFFKTSISQYDLQLTCIRP